MSAPFAPSAAYSLSVTDSSGTTETTIGEDATTMRLYNAGTVTVFVGWGRGDLDVSSSAYMVALPPGVVEMFSKSNANKIAAETASGTATLYVNVGFGI